MFKLIVAAASWNFITFQSPSHSAVMMEFTTPPSYGSTTVTVGVIATDDQILCAGAQEAVQHTSSKHDDEVGWEEPTAINLQWKPSASSSATEQTSATLSGSIAPRYDRIDVLAQIPAFLKTIIAAAAGSKPFIYQYGPEMELKLSRQADSEQTVKGRIFMEATFITG